MLNNVSKKKKYPSNLTFSLKKLLFFFQENIDDLMKNIFEQNQMFINITNFYHENRLFIKYFKNLNINF